MKTIVLITGGFDPIHSGHIAYLQAAKKLGDILVVGVNSDAWLGRKKGRAFMPLMERAAILRAITGVDFVIDFDDSDDSAKHAIWMVRQSYPQDHIVFANGGDRTDTNIPEMGIQDPNLDFVFGVAGVIIVCYTSKISRSKSKSLLWNPGNALACNVTQIVQSIGLYPRVRPRYTV